MGNAAEPGGNRDDRKIKESPTLSPLHNRQSEHGKRRSTVRQSKRGRSRRDESKEGFP